MRGLRGLKGLRGLPPLGVLLEEIPPPFVARQQILDFCVVLISVYIMSLKNCCKITKKPQNGQGKTGKQSCQIFNFLSIKKKVTFHSGKVTFFSYFSVYLSYFVACHHLHASIHHIIFHSCITCSRTISLGRINLTLPPFIPPMLTNPRKYIRLKKLSWSERSNLHYSYSFLLQGLTGSTSARCSLFLFGLAFLLRSSAIFK